MISKCVTVRSLAGATGIFAGVISFSIKAFSTSDWAMQSTTKTATINIRYLNIANNVSGSIFEDSTVLSLKNNVFAGLVSVEVLK